jgi:hypothetical protein
MRGVVGRFAGGAFRRFRDRAVSDNPIVLKQCQNIYEGMRKAGVPEQ